MFLCLLLCPLRSCSLLSFAALVPSSLCPLLAASLLPLLLWFCLRVGLVCPLLFLLACLLPFSFLFLPLSLRRGCSLFSLFCGLLALRELLFSASCQLRGRRAVWPTACCRHAKEIIVHRREWQSPGPPAGFFRSSARTKETPRAPQSLLFKTQIVRVW